MHLGQHGRQEPVATHGIQNTATCGLGVEGVGDAQGQNRILSRLTGRIRRGILTY
jgi:hypothetical protein